MGQLRSRALQDALTRSQLRLDQNDRNTPSGVALPYTPVVSMTGVACTQGVNSGYWCRFNDLLIVWVSVVIGATPGTGSLFISTPDSIALEAFGGMKSECGEWVMEDVNLGQYTTGWFVPQGSTVRPWFSTSGLNKNFAPDAVTDTGPFTLATGDKLYGTIIAKVA